MSIRNTLRATPALFRVGMAEATAYRAEMLVWILSTSMPFVMLALWTAVAHDNPVGRFTQAGFAAYFLCTFIVRQLTGTWAAWQMNFEVRTGTMSMRLLRPVHPLWHFAVENLAYLPMRVVVVVPVVIGIVVWVGTEHLLHDPLLWAVWPLSVFGAWLINYLANAAVGSLSFYMEQTLRVMDVWFLLFMLFSGYLFPVELFPGWVRPVVEAMPFRFIIDLPVQWMTGALTREAALTGLLGQWAWVGAFLLLTLVLWRRGLRRFGAYGG